MRKKKEKENDKHNNEIKLRMNFKMGFNEFKG